jgi:protein-S-isoprenylcysteine O-methyltransferase Ste14
MHSPGDDSNQSLGTAARDVAEHASALARLELELAGLEIKRKIGALAIGIGLAVAAAVLLLYALGFGLAAGAAGLETVLPTWASLLIVAGALLLVIAVLALVAVQAFKRGAPPVPEQAIEEAKRTQEALSGNGSEL